MTIPRRKFRTISSSVEKITKPIFGKRGFGEATIVNDWAHIVGDTLARHTVPEQISYPSSSRSEGTLKLKIDSSALALELQHLIPQLMDKVNTYLATGPSPRSRSSRDRCRSSRNRKRSLQRFQKRTPAVWKRSWRSSPIPI